MRQLDIVVNLQLSWSAWTIICVILAPFMSENNEPNVAYRTSYSYTADSRNDDNTVSLFHSACYQQVNIMIIVQRLCRFVCGPNTQIANDKSASVHCHYTSVVRIQPLYICTNASNRAPASTSILHPHIQMSPAALSYRSDFLKTRFHNLKATNKQTFAIVRTCICIRMHLCDCTRTRRCDLMPQNSVGSPIGVCVCVFWFHMRINSVAHLHVTNPLRKPATSAKR